MKKRPYLQYTIVMVVLLLTGCMSREPGNGAPVSAVPQITQEVVKGNTKSSSDYARFFNSRKDGAIIPGLKQGLVPQSVGYLKDQDWFVIAGYRENQSSLVTIVDANSRQLVKTIQFANQDGSLYAEHAGGLALSSKHLWISSNEQVYFIELDKVVGATDGATLPFSGHIKIDARGSFVIFADGVLWVGDFALAPSYPTKIHHQLTNREGMQHLGWIAGYKIDEQTDLVSISKAKNSSGAYIPDYALSIPDKIQESAFIDGNIVLTESYGRNNPSHWFVYKNPVHEKPHASLQVGNETIPVWFLDRKNLRDTWTLPPMAEAIVERNQQTFAIFESGALKYLNGSYALSRLQVIDTGLLLDGQDGGK